MIIQSKSEGCVAVRALEPHGYAPTPNLLASLLPRVDARLGLGVVRLRPDGTEAYATFYTPNNLAWAVEGCVMPGVRGARAPPFPHSLVLPMPDGNRRNGLTIRHAIPRSVELNR